MKHCLLAIACLSALVSAQSAPERPSRIIVFVLDDVGADAIEQISTPNIDALAQQGVNFTRAYAHSWCKPSRDSLLRGSYEGLNRGEVCNPVVPNSLSTNTPTFVSALQGAGYLTGLIGKWHIGRVRSESLPWWFAPHALGYDHWWAGVGSSAVGNCYPNGYNNVDDGVFSPPPGTPTEVQRDRLFDLIDAADLAQKPLFAMVCFTDAHSPWQRPARSTLPPGYRIPLFPTQRDLFEAEVVALDFVMGQVLARLDPEDWVIVVSENGTPKQVIEPQGRPAKTTVYEGGVRVPMIFNGGRLAPRTIDDPVALYDLGATLLDGLGLEGPRGDGRNLLAPPPRHPFAFVQNPATRQKARAVIERRYKLVENAGGRELYDLLLDPDEQNPLPLLGPEYDRLSERLARLPGE